MYLVCSRSVVHLLQAFFAHVRWAGLTDAQQLGSRESRDGWPPQLFAVVMRNERATEAQDSYNKAGGTVSISGATLTSFLLDCMSLFCCRALDFPGGYRCH